MKEQLKRNLIVAFQFTHSKSWNYDLFFYRLSSLGDNVQLMENLWFLQSDYSAEYCRNLLQEHIDVGVDKVAVFDCLNNSFATWNCNAKQVQSFWTKRYRKPEDKSTNSFFDTWSL